MPEKIRGKKSLNVAERFALMLMHNLLTCFQSNGVPVNGWTSTFADDWGVYGRNLSNYLRTMYATVSA